MRTKWTDDLIEQNLRDVSGNLGHFPSALELRALGRNDLACIVSDRGGFLDWSDRIGIPRQDSDSDFGWRGEVSVCGLFRHREHAAERTEGIKAPFDILVAEILRVDVKTAKYAEYGACCGWFYRIGKIPQADLVFLYQYDTSDFYALPWFVCPTTNITVSRGGGKYAAFKNNWTLVEKMIRDREEERAIIEPLKVAG